MKVPRIRLSVRCLMAAVALIAGCFWVIEREVRFRRLAQYHLMRTNPDVGCCGVRFTGEGEQTIYVEPVTGKPITLARARWHETLLGRYERAVRYPWLPVEADPPRPR